MLSNGHKSLPEPPLHGTVGNVTDGDYFVHAFVLIIMEGGERSVIVTCPKHCLCLVKVQSWHRDYFVDFMNDIFIGGHEEHTIKKHPTREIKLFSMKRATSWENLLMPYANNAQSDQHLCCSQPRQYNTPIFYIRNFKPLPSFCGCAGWFVCFEPW